ncbi:MAG: TATA-box-binding protein [Candidatus Thorarchaeota archaeon]|nr:TATA-box-binding protein [Candidatus Thorarchaeota archaeon]
MSIDKIKTQIENVVASVILSRPIDLDLIVARFPKVEYDPEQFPGLVFRLTNPKTATLIFSTGKMVCTGGKNITEAKRAVRKIVKELNEADINIPGRPIINVQNIVASGDLGGFLNLELAAMTLENCMYEPEQFPGLIYRMRDPKVVVLLFSSGKIVITGAKTEEQIPEVARKVRDRVVELEIMQDSDDIEV